MDCKEVREHLSAYIDKILDSSIKQELEQHLASCANCANQISELKRSIQELASLEKFKAPDNFLEKVRERIKQRGEFEGIMRKLLLPAKVKLPAKAIAVIATVLIITVLVQRNKLYLPGEGIARAPSQVSDMKLAKQQEPYYEPYYLDQSSIGVEQYAKLQPEVRPQESLTATKSISQPETAASYEAISYSRSTDSLKEVPVKSYTSKEVSERALTAAVSSREDIAAWGDYELSTARATALPIEIMLNSADLHNDTEKISTILKDSGVLQVDMQRLPDKSVFSFNILQGQWDNFMSQLKDLQTVSLPAQEIIFPQDSSRGLSVKLTLSTQ